MKKNRRNPKEVWQDTLSADEIQEAVESGKILLKNEKFLKCIRQEMADLKQAVKFGRDQKVLSDDRLFNLVLWGLVERINGNVDWKRGRK